MGIRFRTRELFQPAVNTAEDFTVALRDGVATFACNLWSSFPDFITEGTNPQNGFARGYMNSMCGAIQPPVSAPLVPFTGGQCCDAIYDVTVDYELRRCAGDVVITANVSTISVSGKIIGLILHPCLQSPGLSCLDIIYQDCLENTLYETVASLTNGIAETDCTGVGNTDPDADKINPATSTYDITGVVRTDGMPDNCGDPPARYQSPPPTSNDLNQTINVTVNDGLDLSLELQYIKLSNQYNFPMNFKVNGINVSLDFDGLNFHAPDGFGSPSGGNDVPPPGSDPGSDGAGGDITQIYNDNEYIVAPDSPPPRTVERIIEYILCTDGVIETITEVVKVNVGNLPFLVILLDMVKNILTDLCEMPEATLGLPEYYGLQPGANRPAIVYLWKEYINETWQPSTYSSTVHHPTTAAIAEIENLTSIEKTIGTYKTFVRLSDGSVIQATGDTPANSDANFTFLITQVVSSFLPPDLISATITSVDTRLSVKTLNLRQIEYYPSGKVGNASPSIRRVVEP